MCSEGTPGGLSLPTPTTNPFPHDPSLTYRTPPLQSGSRRRPFYCPCTLDSRQGGLSPVYTSGPDGRPFPLSNHRVQPGQRISSLQDVSSRDSHNQGFCVPTVFSRGLLKIMLTTNRIKIFSIHTLRSLTILIFLPRSVTVWKQLQSLSQRQSCGD